MQKLVINCETGEQQLVELSHRETMARKAEMAAAAERLAAAELAEHEQKKRDADIAAMLEEWRAKR